MRVVVVGSGASAVHFAESCLDRGLQVVMVDVGREKPAAVRPEDSFLDLKANLDDPPAHWLGDDFQAVTYPGGDGEYYGFPPNKEYIFEGIDGFEVDARGFAPLVSFAQGGLAEAWTAGAFPYGEAELRAFPGSAAGLGPYYDLVAERIGICGEVDDLATHLPPHAGLLPPLPTDEHSRELLETYARRRDRFRRLRAVVGRSRVAVLSQAKGDRPACTRLGRCLLGCPNDAFWTPSVTLAALQGRSGFEYRPGLRAVRLELDALGQVGGVLTERTDGSGEETVAGDRVALGAGSLASAKIFLETLRRSRGESPRLTGLMDNRQVLVPFLNWRRIGRRYEPDSYQYHQVALALEGDDPAETIHGLVTTLKTASMHPIVQSLPVDLRFGAKAFGNVHAALGLVNTNFPDVRRESCWVQLAEGAAADGGEAPLVVHYEPPAGESARIQATLRRLGRVLRELGCLVPPGMSHVRPMGASVHYAGMVPMTSEDRPLTATPAGESRDLPGLLFVDGLTFPRLPAKNLTFTLMANAARIADELAATS